MDYSNKDFIAKNNITTNEATVLEAMDVTKPSEPRDFLFKFPEKPDPDEDFILYDKIKAEKSLLKNVVCYYFAGFKRDVVGEVQFTQELVSAYQAAKQALKYVEVVYVSCDKKQAHFDEMMKVMPWLAIPFNDPQVEYLMTKYKIRDFPRLVVIASDGKFVTDDGVKKLLSNPNQFPFVKALGDNVVQIAHRRPNGYSCTNEGCKCKKFEGSKFGLMQDLDKEGNIIGTFMMPILCNGCQHADIYHLPSKDEDEKKKKR